MPSKSISAATKGSYSAFPLALRVHVSQDEIAGRCIDITTVEAAIVCPLHAVHRIKPNLPVKSEDRAGTRA